MLHTRLPSESADFRRSRDVLRVAEVELLDQRERVAQLRRALPLGTVIEDYVFRECPSDLSADDDDVHDVRISDLFTAPDRPLVIDHLMYGKELPSPCPMCTMWVDGFKGVAHHLARNIDFAIAAAVEPAALRAHARTRGWNRLRLLSAGDSTFKYVLSSEEEGGSQDAVLSVFVRDDNGNVRHTYSVSPQISADVHERGIDALCTTWNVLDLAPQGRGDWYSSLDYGA